MSDKILMFNEVRDVAGGPVMVVCGLLADSKVKCLWVAGNELRTKDIPTDSLVLVEGNQCKNELRAFLKRMNLRWNGEDFVLDIPMS